MITNNVKLLEMVKVALGGYLDELTLNNINGFYDLFEENYDFTAEEVGDALTEEEAKEHENVNVWTGSLGDDFISLISDNSGDEPVPFKVVVQDAETMEVKYSKEV